MQRSSVFNLVAVQVIVVLLLWLIFSVVGASIDSAQAAADQVNRSTAGNSIGAEITSTMYLPLVTASNPVMCVYTINGLSGGGCNTIMTLTLKSGGVISGNSLTGLRVNNFTTTFGSTAIYASLGISGPVPSGSAAVFGQGGNHGYGVYGSSNTSAAVLGESNGTYGVVGANYNYSTTTGIGVYGSVYGWGGPSSGPRIGVAGSGALVPKGIGVSGVSSDSDGVRGRSDTGYGVHGFVGQSNYLFPPPAGAWGESQSNVGVLGTSDKYIGVWGGSNSGYAFYSDGNVQQNLTDNGWVKALVHIASGSIDRCYNSQLPSVSSTLGTCGFTKIGGGGFYTITFGFNVKTRYVNVTPEYDSATVPVVATIGFSGTNSVRIRTFNLSSVLTDSAFFLIVY